MTPTFCAFTQMHPPPFPQAPYMETRIEDLPTDSAGVVVGEATPRTKSIYLGVVGQFKDYGDRDRGKVTWSGRVRIEGKVVNVGSSTNEHLAALKRNRGVISRKLDADLNDVECFGEGLMLRSPCKTCWAPCMCCCIC